MGFFQKLKDFGSKVVRGIRKGWDWIKDKAAPVVRKILPVVKTAAPVIGAAVGHPEIGMVAGKVADIADKGLSFIGR